LSLNPLFKLDAGFVVTSLNPSEVVDLNKESAKTANKK